MTAAQFSLLLLAYALAWSVVLQELAGVFYPADVRAGWGWQVNVRLRVEWGTA